MFFVAFRLDDITPTMCWEKFEKLKTLFENYKIKPLLGIIPENEDPALRYDSARSDFWSIMRELKEKGWAIAQHGYKHLYLTQDSGMLGVNNRSEFSGLSFQQQFDTIKKGQELLHKQELQTDIWMAPAHSYDENTLKALAALKFRYVTDGYSFYPYKLNGLTFIPCQMSLPKRLPFGTLTICLHSNLMNDTDIAIIEEFIKKHRKYCINFSDTLEIKVKYSYVHRICERLILFLRYLRLKRGKNEHK